MKKNYSRAVRERAEKIPYSDVAELPNIVRLRKIAEKVEAAHQALCARQRKVREVFKALEVRIEELKTEVAAKREALPRIATKDIHEGDLEMTAAVTAREEIQRLTWQIEAGTDALTYFQNRTLRDMQTEGEQSGTGANAAAYNLECAIEEARLELALSYER